MGLSELAADLTVTAEQCERGVAVVDGTDASLAERLGPFADELPCDPTTAATLVEAYVEGASVGRAAAVASVPETTAAKTLFLLGEPVDPLTPTARRVLDDWLAGELSRTDAETLAGVGRAEFALGAYVATHEPISGAEEVLADALAQGSDENSTIDPLADARSGVDDWL